jgi:hypothetical protein
MARTSERDLDEARPQSTVASVPATDSVIALAAMGVTAYGSCDLLHELVGHGGACVATGGQAVTFSSFHFQCLGGAQPFVCAAGILANIVAGLVFWIVLRRAPRLPAAARYFLWLVLAYNLFSAWGYIVTSTISDSGDWANALRGTALPRQAKGGMALLAGGFYLASIFVAASWLRTYVGFGLPRRVWRLIFVPYLAAALMAATAAMLSGILTRREALTAAISTTLGTWGFLFLPVALLFLRRQRETVSENQAPDVVSFGWSWMVVAVILTIVFVAVLGPGFRLHA